MTNKDIERIRQEAVDMQGFPSTPTTIGLCDELYKKNARIQEFESKIKAAYMEGWADAIYEVGEESYENDMEIAWSISDAYEALKEGK